MVVIEKKDFDSLFAVLGRRGYTIVGPRARDGAIVLDQLASAGDLPHGWTADQAPAHFTMRRRSDDAFFGFTVGPHSWKRYLYPPRTHLFAAVRNGKGFDVTIPTNGAGTKYAFLGVRPCELQALNLLDRVFANGQYADAGYAERRASAFVIAVNCVEPSGTCFCASMDTGPAARQGFDIVLTEIVDGDRHYFMADSGTETGAGVLGEIPHRPAEREEVVLLEGTMKSSAERMGRAMVKADFRPLANAQFEAPEWDEVARRCLSCANCTMVCPTCFCTTVEDVTDLTGSRADRWRRWDSCFTSDFTKVAGGNIRMSTRSRYRQWFTHKLVHWIDQYGSPGCVGCGRCITWCPAGIDLTVEAAFIETDKVQPTP